ncbi:ribosome maturation factor RimM [Ostreibacterium oceani]|uniref:Ribosome maturation factor RimM n=1 Tax=Ostreibacterium oceani TaxID=2654998 RepID=A0A6N7ES61_9GAMM|nr:ribosome maturation factor RimM [Ostreibacterium oceani]MPV85694.1 16S rRNA processing protein RimM [Ostreibacterium oceani]
MDKYIELGKVSSFFGVRGGVKLFSYTRPRLGIGQYKTFYVGESKSAVVFSSIREQGKYVVGYIDGVDSREAVAHLIGESLFIKRSELPALNDKEYYWDDLIGLQVFDLHGKLLGSISSLMETGANDVIVVTNENSDTKETQEILIPFVPDYFVLSVDLDANKMIVDWTLDWEADDAD